MQQPQAKFLELQAGGPVVVKAWGLGMSEAPKLRAPTFTGNPFEESAGEWGGLTARKSHSELETELTHSQTS